LQPFVENGKLSGERKTEERDREREPDLERKKDEPTNSRRNFPNLTAG